MAKILPYKHAPLQLLVL